MKMKLVLLASYLAILPIFVLFLISYQLYLHQQNKTSATQILGLSDSKISHNIVSNKTALTTIAVTSQEARVDVLREFFRRYDSPLEDYAEEIVNNADKYGLDYRLVPAIAMQESTLCLKAPEGLNNCWGFGIYGSKKTAFDDYGQAIQIVSKTLAEKYHANGLVEPREIMTKYTPSSDGSWAESVSYVMKRIEQAM